MIFYSFFFASSCEKSGRRTESELGRRPEKRNQESTLGYGTVPEKKQASEPAGAAAGSPGAGFLQSHEGTDKISNREMKETRERRPAPAMGAELGGDRPRLTWQGDGGDEREEEEAGQHEEREEGLPGVARHFARARSLECGRALRLRVR